MTFSTTRRSKPHAPFHIHTRSLLLKFSRANINTRILAMSHDLQATYQLNSIFVKEVEQKNQNKTKKSAKCSELKDLKLEDIDKKIIKNEYIAQINDIYDYGCNIDTSKTIQIGNTARQVLEAFSTFSYEKGIEEVSTDENILSSLQDESHRKYFNNLLYRLVLNGTSHKSNTVKTMQNPHFFSLISEEEKQKTCQDIICYMYLLNPLHIKFMLKGKDVSVIETWCNKILEK